MCLFASCPASGRSPGRGHGNSLQYSCLENVMDRGVTSVTCCQVTVHGVANSWTWLSDCARTHLGPWMVSQPPGHEPAFSKYPSSVLDSTEFHSLLRGSQSSHKDTFICGWLPDYSCWGRKGAGDLLFCQLAEVTSNFLTFVFNLIALEGRMLII